MNPLKLFNKYTPPKIRGDEFIKRTFLNLVSNFGWIKPNEFLKLDSELVLYMLKELDKSNNKSNNKIKEKNKGLK